MKKTTFISIVLIGVFMSGCLRTRADLETKSENKDLQQQVVTLQQQKAREDMKSQELDEQLRTLRGRIEVLEQNLNQSQTNAANIQAQAARDKMALETKLKVYEEAITGLENKLVDFEKQMNQMKLAATKTSSKSDSPKKGNFASAEVQFGKKEWKKAIVNYNKYRELNPKGRRYATATYKIGVSFQELGLKDEAKAFYQEVISKYPKSREAKKAKYRLKNIKK